MGRKQETYAKPGPESRVYTIPGAKRDGKKYGKIQPREGNHEIRNVEYEGLLCRGCFAYIPSVHGMGSTERIDDVPETHELAVTFALPDVLKAWADRAACGAL